MTNEEREHLLEQAEQLFLERKEVYHKRLKLNKYGQFENTEYIVLLNQKWAVYIFFNKEWAYKIYPFDDCNDAVDASKFSPYT